MSPCQMSTLTLNGCEHRVQWDVMVMVIVMVMVKVMVTVMVMVKVMVVVRFISTQGVREHHLHSIGVVSPQRGVHRGLE